MFTYNVPYKCKRSVQETKQRIKKADYFPHFLPVSIINSCNLRCQGCWVKVDEPRQIIDADRMDKIINDAKAHGNSFFGILGGEPFMHPQLLEILARHPECYFQIFTNGQLITPEIAKELRRLGNCTPLVSIEGNTVVSNERRGRLNVFNRTMNGLQACLDNRLITGVATSVCQTNIDDLLTESWV